MLDLATQGISRLHAAQLGARERSDTPRSDARRERAGHPPLAIGKLREFRELLGDFAVFRCVGLSDLGCDGPRTQARAFWRMRSQGTSCSQSGPCAAIADDSGLEVDALGRGTGLIRRDSRAER